MRETQRQGSNNKETLRQRSSSNEESLQQRQSSSNEEMLRQQNSNSEESLQQQSSSNEEMLQQQSPIYKESEEQKPSSRADDILQFLLPGFCHLSADDESRKVLLEHGLMTCLGPYFSYQWQAIHTESRDQTEVGSMHGVDPAFTFRGWRNIAGAHLPTPTLFGPTKRPDDTADYSLGCSFFLTIVNTRYSFLHLGGLGRALQPILGAN